MTGALSTLLASLQAVQIGADQADLQDIIVLATGISALVLALLSLYAWSRRRQAPLLIVAGAFFLFVLKEIIELVPQQTNALGLILSVIDFIALAAFFVAIVIRPRRKGGGIEAA